MKLSIRNFKRFINTKFRNITCAISQICPSEYTCSKKNLKRRSFCNKIVYLLISEHISSSLLSLKPLTFTWQVVNRVLVISCVHKKSSALLVGFFLLTGIDLNLETKDELQSHQYYSLLQWCVMIHRLLTTANICILYEDSLPSDQVKYIGCLSCFAEERTYILYNIVRDSRFTRGIHM
jgi:hypothetical protein